MNNIKTFNCANCDQPLLQVDHNNGDTPNQPLRKYAYIAGTSPPGALVCYPECAADAIHKLTTTGQLGAYHLPDWRPLPVVH